MYDLNETNIKEIQLKLCHSYARLQFLKFKIKQSHRDHTQILC